MYGRLYLFYFFFFGMCGVDEGRGQRQKNWAKDSLGDGDIQVKRVRLMFRCFCFCFCFFCVDTRRMCIVYLCLNSSINMPFGQFRYFYGLVGWRMDSKRGGEMNERNKPVFGCTDMIELQSCTLPLFIPTRTRTRTRTKTRRRKDEQSMGLKHMLRKDTLYQR
ncbi:hypothetical protein BCR41DRAFT_245685 [Lobosporangium transversale]|uniref:Secreted protein n=1 Tax=Lobosporangium transversale TaxID=64571 RepID=A0A1Y2GVL9_9FUNG|nr:hypothetical protein BCR41DRAFT_245685 [Lobosporangium transversale]ORZ23762.1 hypothetical protein BCR41DRAFT_245685 [Lobosporangium transversale]|eukprot:XP_021883576.1 hypothetical protein BCR41DRAFT_245685 [Lobosporangium transversale]